VCKYGRVEMYKCIGCVLKYLSVYGVCVEVNKCLGCVLKCKCVVFVC